MPIDFVTVTINAAGKKPRKETLEGRNYLVAPITMLTEGVHEGSDGPLYYSKDEIGKAPQAWDHKPIVVYHPVNNGSNVSACSPAVMATRKVGLILNSTFDGKLRTEGWFEIDRTKAVDARVYDAVLNGKTMEVSTGLFSDHDKTPGTWNGEAYTASVKNILPDHLAVLPDEVGACSVKKGAGLFSVNAASREAEGPLTVWNRSLVRALAGLGGKLTDNALSFDDTSRLLSDALGAKFGEPGKYWDGYVVAVYPDRVIFRCDEMDGCTMSIGYATAKDGSVELTGEAVEVNRVVSYQTVTGSVMVENGQGSLTLKETTTMAFDKKAHITSLIGNGWTEAERADLEKLDEKVLAKITPVVPEKTPAPVAPVAPVANAAPAVPTLEQYVMQAPPEFRELLVNGLQGLQAEKVALVAQITANARNTFTPDQLNAKPNGELKALAALAGSVGHANPLSFLGANTPTGNSGVTAPVERLGLPDYSAK